MSVKFKDELNQYCINTYYFKELTKHEKINEIKKRKYMFSSF